MAAHDCEEVGSVTQEFHFGKKHMHTLFFCSKAGEKPCSLWPLWCGLAPHLSSKQHFCMFPLIISYCRLSWGAWLNLLFYSCWTLFPMQRKNDGLTVNQTVGQMQHSSVCLSFHSCVFQLLIIFHLVSVLSLCVSTETSCNTGLILQICHHRLLLD